METEGSLPYSEDPGTGPFPEPDESNPQLPTLFPQDPLQYYAPRGLFPSGFRIKYITLSATTSI